MILSLDQKIAGVLIPVFAIRGKGDQGIGDTASLAEFIDWAADCGFRLVKILPINETGGDNSPYNAISSIALDPTTIRTSPAALPDLNQRDFDQALTKVNSTVLNSSTVEYPAVKRLKRDLLEAAFARFEKNHHQRKTVRGRSFLTFVESNREWIDDYALYRALMEANNENECWDFWPEEHRSPERAREWVARLAPRKAQAFTKRIRFFTYVQWIAFLQWQKVKAFADEREVALMGDIPFGVSYYSADVWANPEIFQRNWSGGTPPDKIFKHDPFVVKWGQNWGIPLYNWDALREKNYSWWRRRVRGVREFFHMFRIDHVLGFYRIYGFPWRPQENPDYLLLSEEEARNKAGGLVPHFHPRPDDTGDNKDANRREGEEYLRMVVEEAGAGRVIGEDLGEVPDYVRPNLTSLGIAGYKIPLWEKRDDGTLIPGRDYQRLSLVTYGTHDHEPLRAIWQRLWQEAEGPDGGGARWELRILSQYAGLNGDNPPRDFTPELHEALLQALFASNSWLAVVMITDLFGRSERFNFPGVAGTGNWTQRLHATVSELEHEPILDRVREFIRASGR